MLKGNCNSPENGYAAMYEYETKFINKVKLAENLPVYHKLEKSAQSALLAHTGCGLNAIRAIAFIDRISAMTNEEFIAWASTLSA